MQVMVRWLVRWVAGWLAGWLDRRSDVKLKEHLIVESLKVAFNVIDAEAHRRVQNRFVGGA
jgi:hypothetical protein